MGELVYMAASPTLLALTAEMAEVLALLETEPDDSVLAGRLSAGVLAVAAKVDGYVAVHDEAEARASALRAASRRLADAAKHWEVVIERLKSCARRAADLLGRDRLAGTLREIRVVR